MTVVDIFKAMPGVDNLSQKDSGETINLGFQVGLGRQSFIPALTKVLSRLASLSAGPPRRTRFHSMYVCGMSIHDYLARICKYFQCSNECFVISIVYISRVMRRNPDFRICDLNIHRLVLTGVVL